MMNIQQKTVNSNSVDLIENGIGSLYQGLFLLQRDKNYDEALSVIETLQSMLDEDKSLILNLKGNI